MSESKKVVGKETVRFHHIVENGSVADLQRVLANEIDVNAPGHLEQTALMVAIAAKDVEKMKLLIDHGADPELTDQFNATPLRQAVDLDFADGVRFLLSIGVDRGHHPKYPLKKIEYDFEMPAMNLPAELQDFISAEEWKEFAEETRDSMTKLGQNPTVEPIISEVQSVELLRMFLAAGDDLNLAPNEVKRAYVGLSNDGEFRSSREDYNEHKSPRYGTSNPERMDHPFWRDMVRLGCDAYSARQQFHDTELLCQTGVVWCFDRFGSSLTQLEDGRFVQIGGEHEDFYDPDFYIYNDVVIHDGKGNFQIYGYPQEAFPPTDFHTATLVGDWIYIIGCLGYPEQREEGRTSVYRLKLESWEIEAVHASGEMPSWLHRHRSRHEPDKKVIRVEGGDLQRVAEDGDLQTVRNEEQFALELSSFRWRKLT